jgi:hypothetical protein
MPKYGGRLSVTDARASERAVLAEPHNAVKVSTACPSSLGLFPHAALYVPVPQHRIPRSPGTSISTPAVSLEIARSAEREFLVAKGQLEEDLAEWRATSEPRKAGALFSGNKLLRARDWLVTRPQDLSVEERQFHQGQRRPTPRAAPPGVRSRLLIFIVVLGFAGYAFYESWPAQQVAEHATDNRPARDYPNLCR